MKVVQPSLVFILFDYCIYFRCKDISRTIQTLLVLARPWDGPHINCNVSTSNLFVKCNFVEQRIEDPKFKIILHKSFKFSKSTLQRQIECDTTAKCKQQYTATRYNAVTSKCQYLKIIIENFQNAIVSNFQISPLC